ncbi:hypothetical protein [Frankia sp. Cas4]|uniref:hypothetical protein n=1 Tax=Frankia sp. Cas4 TaxID=3073927 RepID=UPI002AD28A42|nr:hypothetical protein [Frankia sp. Cas4]
MDRPKSDACARTVSLDTATMTILHTHRTGQDTERLEVGDGWPDTDLVFTQPDDHPTP